jgi:hypothetical protein
MWIASLIQVFHRRHLSLLRFKRLSMLNASILYYFPFNLHSVFLVLVENIRRSKTKETEPGARRHTGRKAESPSRKIAPHQSPSRRTHFRWTYIATDATGARTRSRYHVGHPASAWSFHKRLVSVRSLDGKKSRVGLVVRGKEARHQLGRSTNVWLRLDHSTERSRAPA